MSDTKFNYLSRPSFYRASFLIENDKTGLFSFREENHEQELLYNEFDCDIVVCIPIYTSAKNRSNQELKNYLFNFTNKIKALFKVLKLQIILSNNTTENLHELDDDIVTVIDNNKNLYAFNARRKAFEITNARYFWTLDDDDDIVLETNTNFEQILLDNIDVKDFILSDYNRYYEIFHNIYSHSIIKKIYNIIGNTNIRVYGEDILPDCALYTINPSTFKREFTNFSFLYHKSVMFECINDKNKKNIDILQFINFQKEKKRISYVYYKKSLAYDLKIYKNTFKWSTNDIQTYHNFIKNFYKNT